MTNYTFQDFQNGKITLQQWQNQAMQNTLEILFQPDMMEILVRMNHR
jgi:hypothetical protein